MDLAALNAVATAMVAPGRGILAADESTGTIKKRFDVIGVENIEENRRDYRELLFRSAGGMEHISGVILFEETLYQSAVDGTPFVDLITRAGAIPGIKVDKGASKMAGFPGETITKGLDGLSKRLRKDYEQGARFAKWRAVIDIADGVPTWGAIKSNAHALARYAAICQQEQIVPIVEPEVLMDGAHDIDRCDEVTRWILQTTFQELYEQRVVLEGMVLKPNMIVPGKKWQRPVSVQQVAERTIAALKATVPS
ncbi:MAG: fructose-bisphosphate aldolase class I, partial [Proteobacteria bacterium]|nr:fructose-bisphosphate aldolase class I [Pseudomonadota bacterium]